MKKKTIVILSAIGVMVVATGIVFAWQWNNLRALSYFALVSGDDLSDKLAENAAAFSIAMKKASGVALRELTAEEQRKLQSGELSREDAVRLILGRAGKGQPENDGSVKPASAVNNTENSTEISEGGSDDESGDDALPAENTRLAELLAGIYILKTEFVYSLNDLVEEGKKEYWAAGDSNSIGALALKYIEKAGILEKECDGKMNDLLGEIKKEMEAAGGDLSLVTDIQMVYENEKNLRKAKYLSLLR
jgi:hypothetical protein